MNASSTLLPTFAHPVVEDRDRLATDHCADVVLDLLGSHGWVIVSTPECNVHCTSPDGRVYVGWLPEDAAAWKRGVVWRITVQPVNAEAGRRSSALTRLPNQSRGSSRHSSTRFLAPTGCPPDRVQPPVGSDFGPSVSTPRPEQTTS